CGGSARPLPARTAACTCICSRLATSATGPTVTFRRASYAISTRARLVRSLHLAQARRDGADRRGGATIVTNTSSNLVGSSGIAPVGEFLRRGCRVAMGLDGLSFDEDEDALREMRLAYVIHKASGFDIRMRREDLLRMAFEHGRFAVTGARNGGRIAPGAPADLLVLDWDKLSA